VDKAQIEAEAEVAAEATVRARRIEEEHIQRLKEDLEARRKAREAAELVYSSDLATTLRRLRELELELDGSRAAVSSAYERRRLHDALRRIRTSRLSLGEQALDNDYRSRRLGSLLDSPALYAMPTTLVCATEHLLVDERSCWPTTKVCGAMRCANIHPYPTFIMGSPLFCILLTLASRRFGRVLSTSTGTQGLRLVRTTFTRTRVTADRTTRTALRTTTVTTGTRTRRSTLLTTARTPTSIDLRWNNLYDQVLLTCLFVCKNETFFTLRDGRLAARCR
jgi:hypothetical protein